MDLVIMLMPENLDRLGFRGLGFRVDARIEKLEPAEEDQILTPYTIQVNFMDAVRI